MNQHKADVETDKWASYYALIVQEAYKKEIERAIEQVKSGAVSNSCQKRRKRGYWTPVGFYWFRRKKKWRDKDRFNRDIDRGQRRY